MLNGRNCHAVSSIIVFSIPATLCPFTIAIKASNSFSLRLRLRKSHGFCKKDTQNGTTFKNNSYLCAELSSAAMCSGALVRNST